MTSRDPRLGATLLLKERDALLPILRATDTDSFTRPTVLPGWNVREVLAHCAAALNMAASDSLHGFSDAENAADLAARADWPVSAVLDELEAGYAGAAEEMGRRGTLWDGLALGEWVHGGDVRHALGVADAWASAGIDDALVLLVERTAQPQRGIPATEVTLPDRTLHLGDPDEAPVATLVTDTATLVRLCCGREPEPERFRLTGADPKAYVCFR
ncbi:maleylpyruvate isomerase family mycothiol-dependent enzyme [Yinghuangia seranimata]|uniref:maleylpyruvate isomerase family mycothiol-dependent enzyme n=1 Tax=Yinghuangia seranimata TaxID=408067 RepID=UPI00248C4BE6|nr:maleylpyruvate isomerase family mycothiol-dependent enzyme [Yinghuangia seranimata]MDI2130629.1 maleylpyruvate isomerase family mycothiol-dependent enzyme [Yinghuangia seranimata]